MTDTLAIVAAIAVPIAAVLIVMLIEFIWFSRRYRQRKKKIKELTKEIKSLTRELTE